MVAGTWDTPGQGCGTYLTGAWDTARRLLDEAVGGSLRTSSQDSAWRPEFGPWDMWDGRLTGMSQYLVSMIRLHRSR